VRERWHLLVYQSIAANLPAESLRQPLASASTLGRDGAHPVYTISWIARVRFPQRLGPAWAALQRPLAEPFERRLRSVPDATPPRRKSGHGSRSKKCKTAQTSGVALLSY